MTGDYAGIEVWNPKHKAAINLMNATKLAQHDTHAIAHEQHNSLLRCIIFATLVSISAHRCVYLRAGALSRAQTTQIYIWRRLQEMTARWQTTAEELTKPICEPSAGSAPTGCAASRTSIPGMSAVSCYNWRLALFWYTQLVSNSAPTWSSRCCFTACRF